ncbi:MAG: sigma-70 family RNA polymerase sigma factor [Arachidicoccus sp.]|nr:sigma-70 family RNA polymerase sigma factor [Arachidicoccus sp.]
MKSERTEQELLDGLANNDTGAIETIYANNFNTILSLVVNNNGSYDDARDIFQEAMVVLYEKVKTGSFALSSQLKTYLYAVSRRLWLKRLQLHGKYFVSSEFEIDESSFSATEDIADAKEKDAAYEIMEVALSKLGEPCKSLLESFYIHKKGMNELADMFGYTNTDNAKTQKYKCLMRLKKIFFAQYKIKE